MKTALHTILTGMLFFGVVGLPAVHGAIIDVDSIIARSEFVDDDRWKYDEAMAYRDAVNLRVSASTTPSVVLGLDKTTCIYTPSTQFDSNGRYGWMSGNTGNQHSNLWIAFGLAEITDLESMYIWNFGASGQRGRDTKSFNMYIVTESQAITLGSFDSVFQAGQPLTLVDNPNFTFVQNVALTQASGDSVSAQQINLNTSLTQDTQWVVFANFTSYGDNNYVGLGKVAFLDDVPSLGIVPENAKASSTNSTNGTDRVAIYTIQGRGLDTINIFDPDKRLTHQYTGDSAHTSWLGARNATSDQWLAFDLAGDTGQSFDLEGLYAWNYSQSGDYEGLNNTQRGVKDFKIYVVTQSDLDALSSTLDFESAFSGDLTDLLDPSNPLSGLLNLVTPEGAADGSTPFTMEQSQANTAEQQDFFFADSVDDVAWVLMAIENNWGGLYTGLGQIQFMGSLHDSSSGSNVPEPAAWLMLMLGLGGLCVIVRRRRT